MWHLENRKALITGGTKGIGKATVLEFLELKAEVLFTARNEQVIIDLEKELTAKGYKVKGLVADASSNSDLQKVEDWIKEN